MGRALDDLEVAEAYNAALDLERAGDVDGAVAGYERLLILDPADHGGARVRLAALRRGAVPARAPDAYVETLFDQTAFQFEEVLVDGLGYQVPKLMQARLDALGLGPFGRMLDLGCGTGLAAEAMRDRAEEIIGLDLSSRMLDVCEDKDIYDGLYCGEVEAFLADNDEARFELISACDVLPYLGDLTPFFSGAAANLVPGGVLAFSAETLDEAAVADAPYLVTPHQRFAHAAAYLRDGMEAAGFSVQAMDAIDVRLQNGVPTPGYLVVARFG